MTKTLLASALAACLALTAVTATPAAAMDRGERNRLILGLGTLFALGAIASQNNKRHVNRNNNNPTYYEPPRRHEPPRHYEPRNRNVVKVPAYCIHGRGQNRWVDWQCARQAGY